MTEAMTRNATFSFGLSDIVVNAYFPYYGAELSNLSIVMDLDP